MMKFPDPLVNRRTLFASLGSSLTLCTLGSDMLHRMVTQSQPPAPALKAKSQQLLESIMHADDFSGRIPVRAVQELANSEATTVSGVMIRLLALARTYSRAPISNYHVGAVARGLSGSLYLGMNLEIPGHSLGFSVHGEQSALSNAYMHGETGVAAIAVTAAPCGHCRQFMNEMSPTGEIEILVEAKAPMKLSSLLPMAFGPRDLGFQNGAFPVKETKLSIAQKKGDDEVSVAALAAAEHSYAPYSGALSGVAIRMKAGRIYKGAYLENAAFNPSLSPLQTALVQLILAGENYDRISRVALVELRDAKISQVSVTRAVLSTIAPEVELQTMYATRT